MKKSITVSVIILLFFSVALSSADKAKIEKDCTFKGKPLYGKVQIVEHFPDFKVQVVENFPDLKVDLVENFPDKCGKWKMVDNFPDFKIQMVEHFPDFKIKYVDHFPGLP